MGDKKNHRKLNIKKITHILLTCVQRCDGVDCGTLIIERNRPRSYPTRSRGIVSTLVVYASQHHTDPIGDNKQNAAKKHTSNTPARTKFETGETEQMKHIKNIKCDHLNSGGNKNVGH